MIADRDDEVSVPIDPYGLLLVLFLALQGVVVAAILIRRVWKNRNGNSN
jgi:DNA-binding winged helix-turn-helix (wHTH) protein